MLKRKNNVKFVDTSIKVELEEIKNDSVNPLLEDNSHTDKINDSKLHELLIQNDRQKNSLKKINSFGSNTDENDPGATSDKASILLKRNSTKNNIRFKLNDTTRGIMRLNSKKIKNKDKKIHNDLLAFTFIEENSVNRPSIISSNLIIPIIKKSSSASKNSNTFDFYSVELRSVFLKVGEIDT
jgi:hypothetical protein